MKILVIADIHGYSKETFGFFDKIKENPDVVICPGDFTDMFSNNQGLSQYEIAELVLQKLLSFNKPLLCVPGNHDPYEITDLFNEYGTNLHGKRRTLNGFSFVGFGGAATPFRTIFEPTEEEIREGLSPFAAKTSKNTILVVHNPPKNTKLDRIETGEHVGSQEIRRFVERAKPLLVISAHIHENNGTDRIGETTLFYPGPFYEGNYGIVRITKNKVACEAKTLNTTS